MRLRFVIGVNDDYIDPDFTTEDIGAAVDHARSLVSYVPGIWKVDIEARRYEDDDTLLVMVVYENSCIDPDDYDDVSVPAYKKPGVS